MYVASRWPVSPLVYALYGVVSLLAFVAYGLDKAAARRRRWRTPIEKEGDAARRELLARRIKPFLLRRRKDEVATELPPKTEIVRSVELEGGQRDLYETVRVAMQQQVQQIIAERGLANSHIYLLDAMLKLRQVCCDPRLVNLPQAQQVAESAKLELLLTLLDELLEEGRRVLLFSQFTSMLDLIAVGYSLGLAASVLWFGAIGDRYGRKKTIVAGFLGVFAGYAVYTLVVVGGLSGAMSVTAIFLALTASRAFVGAFLSAVPSGAQALMADITSPSERAGGMAIIGGATGLGLIVGPAVSGVLVAGGITWPLYAATALCASGALAALFFLKAPPVASPVRPQRTSLFSAALQPWLVAGILLWVAIATVQISAGFYFQDRLNLDGETAAGMLSVALTLVGIAMFVVQFLQVRIMGFTPRALVLSGAGSWIAGLLLLLSTANASAYYLAYTLLGLGAGFLLPGIMAGASLAVGHDDQGVAAGLVSASQGIGFIIGPAASTMLYEWNETLPFWSLAGLMVVLILRFAFIPVHGAPFPNTSATGGADV